MLDYLYEWIRQIAYYMVLVTVVMQVVAGHSYRKYIRLFTGVILVLMILAPVLRIFESRKQDVALWADYEYEAAAERIEEKIQEMEQAVNIAESEELSDVGTMKESEDSRNKKTGQIEVEEIRIGR
ncbi:MAG: stage III sporulation protein AF [Eubacteriales bacterium]|nr:stage III sporulation protein AF [Eubacteriales bacterium]